MILLLLLLLYGPSCMAVPDSSGALAARQGAMDALKLFQPVHDIPGFTTAPSEAQIKIEEGDTTTLTALGAHRVAQDDTAFFVSKEEQRRAKAHPNTESQALDYAERLLENPDEVLDASCHKIPVPCEETMEEKACEEHRQYTDLRCHDELQVSLSLRHHTKMVRFIMAPDLILNLTQCDPNHERICRDNLFHLDEHCEYLDVDIKLLTAKRHTVTLKQRPTCSKPTLILDVSDNSSQVVAVQVEVREWVSEDHWGHASCEHAQCALTATNPCQEAYQTKLIDGIPVTRNCWGIENTYQCPAGITSTCQPLIDAGCHLANTSCITFTGERCDASAVLYQCITKTCFPDKEVCRSSIPCAGGECDQSQVQVSDDINEGLGRLGTLTGTAEEVAKQQSDLNAPNLFQGVYQECEKYPLGLRDCCSDEGLLDGMIHCPKELQSLQVAKLEQRAFFLGKYQPRRVSTTRYAYCVFPTKLAGILQIQGRLGQLGRKFGDARHPNCGGISISELSHLDFGHLNIDALLQELSAKKTLPESEALEKSSEQKVEKLHQQGVAHD